MKLPLFFLAAVAAVPVSAQDFEEAPTPLDPLVVTATRSEQWQSDIVASVDVISRADIERAQANDLADLLRSVAGVDVARNGGPGSSASVFIRGLESNHTLFLVDGVRYTTETFLNAQIQNLAPEMIERIEVVKGPRSGLWGSDAMGGVVQIITRRAATGLGGNLSLRGGSFGTRDAAGFIGYRDERSEVAFSLQGQSFNGFPPLRSGTVDRGHENLNAHLRGDRRLGPVRVGLRHLGATGTNEYVDYFGAPKSQDFTNRVSAIEASASLDRWDTRGTLSLTSDNLVQREPSDPARPDRYDFTKVQRRAAEWENQLTLNALTVVGGLAASRSAIDSGFFSEFGDSFVRNHSSQYAAFGRASTDWGPVAGAAALRYAHHNQFGGYTTGDFSLGWHLGSTRLGFTGGLAYKEPELTDLHGDFGNPDLLPERSASIEANLRQSIGGSQSLTLAVFQTIVSNLIVYNPATFAPDNIERARVRGLEAGWRLYSGGWDLGLTGSMQNPVNETTHQALPRRSRRSLNAHTGRDFGPWSTQIELQAHGARADVGAVRLGGYGVLNSSLGYAFAPKWRLSLRADNLLDKDYQLINSFRTPGRSGSLELRASF